MERFCENCGRPLAEGELCNCRDQTSKEGEVAVSAYADNIMKGKKYSLSSSSYMTIHNITSRGRFLYKIEADDEKLNIRVDPKRNNTMPQIYFKDIRDVTMGSKMSGYLVFVAIFFAIAGLFTGFALTLSAPVWLWIGHNKKITIHLTNGSEFVIYESSSKLADEFVKELKHVLQL